MKFWIDITHPPHVLFFRPLIEEFKKVGIETVVTTRNEYQVDDLCRQFHIKFHSIGKHYGKYKFFKAYGLLVRVIQLSFFAHQHRFDLAISHGSPYQSLSAYLLGIPSIFLNDYEHPPGHKISKRFATKIFLSDYIPNDIIKQKGFELKKVIKYPGLKENIYISDFIPDKQIYKQLGLKKKDILVTIRPPAVEAHYQNPESEKLFWAVLNYLTKKESIKIIILTRRKKEKDRIYEFLGNTNGKLLIPSQVINGLNLIYHSDLVISGGGTMVREAVALGVPAYSIFKGEKGAVDKYLENNNKLFFINKKEDIPRIKVKKKEKIDPKFTDKLGLRSFITSEILSVINFK